MDIHWRNKVIKLITVSLIIFTLIGCGSHKKIAENTVSRSTETSEKVESIVKENPYKIEVKETVVFTPAGIIVPMKLSIKKDGIIGEVILTNNELTYTLEKADTTTVRTEIKERIVKDNKVETKEVIEKKKGFFERIKSYANTILWTLIAIVIIYIVYKISRKLSFPI